MPTNRPLQCIGFQSIILRESDEEKLISRWIDTNSIKDARQHAFMGTVKQKHTIRQLDKLANWQTDNKQILQQTNAKKIIAFGTGCEENAAGILQS